MTRTIHFAIDNEWGERKDSLGKKNTWEKVIQEGIIALEKTVQPPESPKKPAYFILDKSEDVLVREFDMVKDNVWVTVAFNEIPLKGKFRVREDAKVIKTEGHKEMIKLGEEFIKDGASYAEVLPV